MDDFELIESIIAPIERRRVETGKYYVSVDSGPFNSEGWDLPEGKTPGEWRMYDERFTRRESKLVRLYTLSGLLIGPLLKSELYCAEYRGESEKLHRTYVTHVPLEEDKEAKRLQYIDKGMLVEKARLLYKVESWGVHSALSFACDCAKRALDLIIENGTQPEKIFFVGLEFARALADYANKCYLIGDPAKDTLALGVRYFSASQSAEYTDMRKLAEEIKEKAESKLGSARSAGLAVANLLDNFFSYPRLVVATATQARVARAFLGNQELAVKGVKTSLFRPKSPERMELLERVWMAFQKDELDWQVKRFNELLGE
jgi:hypothetical protein